MKFATPFEYIYWTYRCEQLKAQTMSQSVLSAVEDGVCPAHLVPIWEHHVRDELLERQTKLFDKAIDTHCENLSDVGKKLALIRDHFAHDEALVCALNSLITDVEGLTAQQPPAEETQNWNSPASDVLTKLLSGVEPKR